MSKNYKYGFVLTGDSKMAVHALEDVSVQAGRTTKSFSNFSKELSTSEKWLRRIGVINFAQISAPLISGFTNSAKATVDFADKVQKLSIRLGMSTEAISEFQHVADLTGVSFNTLSMGFQRQTRRISEAAVGTGEAVKALNELNLSAQKLNQLRPEEQFEVLADALNGVESEADKVRLAMKFWDSEGVALLQTIDGGSESIRGMRDEAAALGKTINQETADALAGMNDSFTRLHAVTSGTATQLLAELAPTIVQVNQFLADSADTVGNFGKALWALHEPFVLLYSEAIKPLWGGLTALASAMLDYYPVVITTTAAMIAYSKATGTATVSNEVFGASFSKLKKGFLLFSSFLAGWSIGAFLREEFEEVRIAGIYMVDGLLKAANYLQSGFEITWAAIKLPFDLLITGIQKEMADLIGDVASLIDAMPDVLVPDGWADSLKQLKSNLDPAESAADRFNNTLYESRAELENSNAAITSITDEMVNFEYSVKESKVATDDAKNSLNDYTGSQDKAEKATKNTTSSVKKQIEMFNNLTPAIQKYEELILGITSQKRQLDEDLWAAEDLLQSGYLKSQEELDTYKKKLIETYEEGISGSKGLEKQTTSSTDAMSSDWDRLNENIQSEFIDRFTDMLLGAENSFEDFAKSILKMWINTTMNMAFNPQLSGSVSGGTAGLTGQMGGGMGSFNPSSLLNSSSSLFNNPNVSIMDPSSWGGIYGQPIQSSMITGVPQTAGVMGPTMPTGVTTTVNGAGGFSPYANSGAAGLVGGYVAGQVGGWEGVAAGGLASAGTVAASGALFGATSAATGATVTGMAGAGAALAAVPVIGWIAAAAAILYSSGVFGSEKDVSPDLNLSTTGGRVSGPLNEYNKNIVGNVNNPTGYEQRWLDQEGGDISATYGGRFGGIGFSTQHDAFGDGEKAKQYAEAIMTRYRNLEEMIYTTLGEKKSEAVSKAMDEFLTGVVKYEEMGEEGTDAIEAAFNRIFTNVFDAIGEVAGEQYNDIFKQFTDAFNVDTGVVAATGMAELRDVTVTTFEFMTDAMYDFARNAPDAEQALAEIAATVQLFKFADANEDFELFVRTIDDFGKRSVEYTAQEVLRLGTNLLDVNAIFENTNTAIYELSINGALLVDSLIEGAGGIEEFNSKMSYFYNNFYTESERYQNVLDDTNEAIKEFNDKYNTNITDANSFRELWEGLDKTTESGIEAANALLNFQTTIVANTNAIKELEKIEKERIDAQIKAAEDARRAAEAAAKEWERIAGNLHVMQKNAYDLYGELSGETELQTAQRHVRYFTGELSGLSSQLPKTVDEFLTFYSALDFFDPFVLQFDDSLHGLGQSLFEVANITRETAEEQQKIAMESMTAMMDIYSNLEGLGDSAVERWKLSTFDDGEKYDYYNTKATKLYEQLANTTDISEINRLTREIYAIGDTMFNLLDVDQKDSVLSGFIGAADVITTTSQDNAQEAITNEINQSQAMQDAMTQIVADSNTSSQAQLDAAKILREAAEAIERASQSLEPSEVGF